MSNKQVQKIYFTIKIIQFDQHGNEVWSKKTNLISEDLNRNEEKPVLSIDSNVSYPLTLSFNVMTHPKHVSLNDNNNLN